MDLSRNISIMSKLVGDIKPWKWKDCNEKLNMLFTVILKKVMPCLSWSCFYSHPQANQQKLNERCDFIKYIYNEQFSSPLKTTDLKEHCSIVNASWHLGTTGFSIRTGFPIIDWRWKNHEHRERREKAILRSQEHMNFKQMRKVKQLRRSWWEACYT